MCLCITSILLKQVTHTLEVSDRSVGRGCDAGLRSTLWLYAHNQKPDRAHTHKLAASHPTSTQTAAGAGIVGWCPTTLCSPADRYVD